MFNRSQGKTVAVPVGRCFAFVADVKNAPQWNKSCVRLEVEGNRPLRKGEKLTYVFDQGGHQQTMTGFVKEFQEGSRLSFQFDDDMFTVTVGFEFEPSGNQTLVHHFQETVVKGWVMWFLTPAIWLGMRVQVQRHEDNLVECLRASA